MPCTAMALSTKFTANVNAKVFPAGPSRTSLLTPGISHSHSNTSQRECSFGRSKLGRRLSNERDGKDRVVGTRSVYVNKFRKESCLGTCMMSV
jgi:hypothetical protein